MELNLAEVHEALADAFGDRPCLIWRGRTWTWSDVNERTRRLANLLIDRGITRHGSLDDCAPWESPHSHVGLYLTNSNAYLEGMLGASKAGAAAFNVNYRYVADELRHLFDDSAAEAIIYHGRYAETLGAVLPTLAVQPKLLLRVDDRSGDELLPGALDYEEALAASTATRPPVDWHADDFYVVYTGGTTGAPKGVLWRQADFLEGALGFRRKDGTSFESLEEIIDAAATRTLKAMPTPPLMHGAAHWNAISAWLGGGTIVMQDVTDRLDAADVLDICEHEHVTSLLIVGDAFARPLVDELRRRPRDLSALRHILTGGAILSPSIRRELLDLVPSVKIVDVLGSSESGRQGVGTTDRSASGGFVAGSDTAILSVDRTRLLARDEDEVGWLAQGGPIPRGYLGDERKTRSTFQTVEGRRVAVAGDRARWNADGSIDLQGRDSVTINTGGEKVYAEEVEQALKAHPAVYDVLVVGRPDDRWGQSVAAVVSFRSGRSATLDDLIYVASEHLARYKMPKVMVVRPEIVRSPSGKPDYAWARAQVTTG